MSAERLKLKSYWDTKNSHKQSNSKWKAEEIWINFDDSELSENNNLIELFGVHVVVEDGREYIYFMTDCILKCLDPDCFQDIPKDKQAMIMEWMLLTKGEKCDFKDCFFSYVMGMHFVYDEVYENMVYTRSCPILLFNGDSTNVQEKEKVGFLKELREALFLYLSGMKKKYLNGDLKKDDESDGSRDNENSDEESLNLTDICSEYESFESESFDKNSDSDKSTGGFRTDESYENDRLNSLDYFKVKQMVGGREMRAFKSDEFDRFTSLSSNKYSFSFDYFDSD